MTQSTVNSIRSLRALLMASLIAALNKTGTCQNESWIFNHAIHSHIRYQGSPTPPLVLNWHKKLRNKKKRLFRQAKQTNSLARWHVYKSVLSEYRAAIKEAKRVFLNDTLPSILVTNPSKFWKTVKPRKKKNISLTNSDGQPVRCEECCIALNDFFVTSFSSCSASALPQMPSRDFLPMYPVTVDAVGVQNLIHKLKLSSSCGVDEINSKFLKNTALYSSIYLSLTFSQSIQTSTLPLDWKVGKVVPLHKSGNTQSPLNYRPISLTSVPCKILEHVIYSNLVSFLESNSFLLPTSTDSEKVIHVKPNFFILLMT